MVTAMIKLARSPQFPRHREHVEDMSALDSAKRMGVDFVQGYQVGAAAAGVGRAERLATQGIGG